MDGILASVKWQFALVYLDDVVIFWNSPEEHIAQVRSVLILLGEASVTLKLLVCFFFHERINYLRQEISPGILTVNPKTRGAITNLKPMTKVSKQRYAWTCLTYLEGSFQTLTAYALRGMRKSANENPQSPMSSMKKE